MVPVVSHPTFGWTCKEFGRCLGWKECLCLGSLVIATAHAFFPGAASFPSKQFFYLQTWTWNWLQEQNWTAAHIVSSWAVLQIKATPQRAWRPVDCAPPSGQLPSTYCSPCNDLENISRPWSLCLLCFLHDGTTWCWQLSPGYIDMKVLWSLVDLMKIHLKLVQWK